MIITHTRPNGVVEVFRLPHASVTTHHTGIRQRPGQKRSDMAVCGYCSAALCSASTPSLRYSNGTVGTFVVPDILYVFSPQQHANLQHSHIFCGAHHFVSPPPGGGGAYRTLFCCFFASYSSNAPGSASMYIVNTPGGAESEMAYCNGCTICSSVIATMVFGSRCLLEYHDIAMYLVRPIYGMAYGSRNQNNTPLLTNCTLA